jgi:hypothetical protein
MNIGQIILELTEEKRRLLEQKEAIASRVAVIDQIVEGYKFLGNPAAKLSLPPQVNQLGLQDAVRAVFQRAAPLPLQPTEVRNALIYAGIRGSSSKNLLISVHTVIGRIADELDEVSQPEGKTAYRWKGAATLKNAYEQGIDGEKKREKPWVNVQRRPQENAMQLSVPPPTKGK